MEYGVLGPLEVRDGDERIAVGGRQPRVLLCVLLEAQGSPVTADVLLDALWGDHPPATATGTLYSYLSRLRKLLAAHDPDFDLTLDGSGYRLSIAPEALDAARFERLVQEGRERLAAGRPDAARPRLTAALDLWRGAAWSDLPDRDRFRGVGSRLDELRIVATEAQLDADLALGRNEDAVLVARAVLPQHPLREGLYARLARALYASGRQTDALDVLADARRVLRDEAGLDPGRELTDLEVAILNHDLDVPIERAGPLDSRPSTPDAPVLLGRGDEVAVLTEALEAVRSGARFVVIDGEPGIGKTRLLDEVRQQAVSRGLDVVLGSNDEAAGAPALWTWLPLLRWLDDLRGRPALTELVLGEPAELLAGSGSAVRFQRFDAIATAIERRGTDGPIVVLIDDLQWADAASLELVTFLATRLQRGALVVATVRTLDARATDGLTAALAAIARRPGSRRLSLRGISDDDTLALLTEHEGMAADDPAATRIVRRAEGNPFFAIELARLARTGPETSELPGTVRDVARRRLGHLPDDTGQVLTAAAVAGRELDLELLSAVTGKPMTALLDALDAAAAQQLIADTPERPGRLRFTHPLIREALLDRVTTTHRARLHLQVADAMEARGVAPDHVEILAEHLWRAASIAGSDRAATALEAAAEVALQQVGYEAAEEQLRRAARLRRLAATNDSDAQRELATLWRLLEVLQATRYFHGADRDVLQRGQELAERIGDDEAARQLLWCELTVLGTAARIDEARVLTTRYAALCADHPDPVVRAGGAQAIGVDLWKRGEVAASLPHFTEAVELLADAPAPTGRFDHEQRQVARGFQAFIQAHCDARPDVAFARYKRLIEASPPASWPTIAGFSGALAVCLGDWHQLREDVDGVLEADPSAPLAFWGSRIVMYRGLVSVEAGDIDGGLREFARGEEHYRGLGARSALPLLHGALAILLAPHDVAPAQDALATARDELDRFGERWNAPMVLLAQAVVEHALHGDPVPHLTAATAEAGLQGSRLFIERIAEVTRRLGLDPALRSVQAG